MATFREVYQQYVNHSHDQRVAVAQKAAANVLGALKDGGVDDDGKYYITCPAAKLILKGSTKNSDIFKATGATQYEDLLFGDTINLDILLKEDYVSIHPQEDGTYIFETRSGANFGLTESGGGDGTVASGRPFTKFTISINSDGFISASVTANLESGDVTYYLGCNTSNKNFKLYKTNYENVVIYKVN